MYIYFLIFVSIFTKAVGEIRGGDSLNLGDSLSGHISIELELTSQERKHTNLESSPVFSEAMCLEVQILLSNIPDEKAIDHFEDGFVNENPLVLSESETFELDETVQAYQQDPSIGEPKREGTPAQKHLLIEEKEDQNPKQYSDEGKTAFNFYFAFFNALLINTLYDNEETKSLAGNYGVYLLKTQFLKKIIPKNKGDIKIMQHLLNWKKKFDALNISSRIGTNEQMFIGAQEYRKISRKVCVYSRRYGYRGNNTAIALVCCLENIELSKRILLSYEKVFEIIKAHRILLYEVTCKFYDSYAPILVLMNMTKMAHNYTFDVLLEDKTNEKLFNMIRINSIFALYVNIANPDLMMQILYKTTTAKPVISLRTKLFAFFTGAVIIGVSIFYFLEFEYKTALQLLAVTYVVMISSVIIGYLFHIYNCKK